MKLLLHPLPLLGLLFMWTFNLHTAEMESGKDYSILSWQTEDGLPQNSVTCMIQTRDGYVWAGTFNGLVRFDGIKFTLFTVANTPTMRSDNINALIEDDKGILWIGTEGGGLLKLENSQISACTNIAEDTIESLALDLQHRLLAGTLNGILRIDGNKVEKFILPEQNTKLTWISSIASTPSGEIWANTDQQLYKLGHDRLEISPLAQVSKTVFAGIQGELWVGGTELGLICKTQNLLTNYQNLSDSYTRCVYHARNGDLWVGGAKGLYRSRNGQISHYTTKEGLNSNEVISIFEDKEGSMWIGSNGGGLHHLRENLILTYSTRNGLPGDDVVTLMQDSQKRIWIGSFNQGVCLLETNRFMHLNGMPGPNYDAVALCQTRQGSILVGSPAGYLYSYHKGVVTTENRSSFEGARVLFEDRDGGLWIGSTQAGVEHRMGATTNFYSRTNGLSHNYVTAIVQEKGGAIWIGTKSGLNRIENRKITSFSRNNGLGADVIHTLFIDRHDTVWIGTAGGGLSRFKKGDIKTVSRQQGLVNDVVAQIIEDDNGYLWVGSNAGLCRFNLQELESCMEGRIGSFSRLVLTRGDGLLNNEFAGSFQPACVKDSLGKLWFSTVGGVVVIDPKSFTQESAPPDLHIEAVIGDGKSLLPILSSSLQSDTVQIQAGIQRVEIHYTGLSFSSPESIRFKCQLEGFDNQWIDVGTRRIAYYSGLPPGRYRFQVNGCNSNGQWNSAGVGIYLVIHPFFWQTLAFKLLLIAGLAGTSAAAAFHFAARKHQQALELAERKSEQLRTIELSAANQKLQARTTELEEAIKNVQTLTGLIPICASCKKIRDDKGYWNRVEQYIQDHTDAKFTHGICPDCAFKLYGDKQKYSNTLSDYYII